MTQTNERSLYVEPNPSPYLWDVYTAFGHGAGGVIWSMTDDGRISVYTATNTREKHNSKKVRAAGVSPAGPGGNAAFSGRYDPKTKTLTAYTVQPTAPAFTRLHLRSLERQFPDAVKVMPFVMAGGFGPGVVESDIITRIDSIVENAELWKLTREQSEAASLKNLRDLENSSGDFARTPASKQVQRDATRLLDDPSSAAELFKKYAKYEQQGLVQGGPGKVRTASMDKRVMARAARNLYVHYTAVRDAVEAGKDVPDRVRGQYA